MNTKLFSFFQKQQRAFTKDDLITTIQYAVFIVLCIYFTYEGSPGVKQAMAENSQTFNSTILPIHNPSAVSYSVNEQPPVRDYVKHAYYSTLKIGRRSDHSPIRNRFEYIPTGYCCLHGVLPEQYYCLEWEISYEQSAPPTHTSALRFLEVVNKIDADYLLATLPNYKPGGNRAYER